MNRKRVTKWVIFVLATIGLLAALPSLGSLLFAKWAQTNRGFQRHYGHVPLSQALANYLADSPRRMPGTWQEFTPYLDPLIKEDPAYSLQLIRQEFDLAWGIDLVQAYSPSGCQRAHPLIFLRHPAPEASLPWCIGPDTAVGILLVNKGLVTAPARQRGS